ncbi:MAG: hypothetical protein ACK5UE_09350 [Chitinophagales bacterium]|jgi:hypothetical protein
MNLETKKLSFAELKEKANNTSQNEMMEKIQGGAFADCHGFWGGVGKAVSIGWDVFWSNRTMYGVKPQEGGPESKEGLKIYAESMGIELSSDAFSEENIYLAFNPAR